MALKDNISEEYHRRVAEFMDNQSRLNIYDPLSQGEQEEIWQEISSEMDIGEVWEIISSDLDRLMPLRPGYGTIFKSLAVLLIFALALIPVKKEILHSGIVQKESPGHSGQTENTTAIIKDNRLVVPDPEEPVYGEPSPPSWFTSGDGEDEPAGILAGYIRTGLNDHTSIIDEEGLDAGMTDTIEEGDVTTYVPHEEIHISRPGIFSLDQFNDAGIRSNWSTTGILIPSFNEGRISIGLITMVKNTWLLNQETFDGLKTESLNSTLLVISPDVGLSLNYSLNDHWKLQADGFFYSNTGQEYLQYIYGRYSRKNITLTYSKIALSVKYTLAGKKSVMSRSSINLVAGSYLSVLHHADQIINNDRENIESQYGKLDYGLRIGSEISLHLFDHFSIVPGLFLSIGMPNIYEGDGNIPGYFRRTHNANAGFQLVFYYQK